MRVLALETSSRLGGVAVLGDGAVPVELSAEVPGAHLEWLLGAIDEALERARLLPADIEGLAVSLGPGSFIGLRVGVATAAAWAHIARRPIVGVSTLEVVAAGSGASGLVLAALDARRGEVVAALFRCDGVPERLCGDLLSSPRALVGRLPDLAEPLVVTGDALERHAEELLGPLAPLATPAPRSLWAPRAVEVGRIGRLRLARGERDDPAALVPVYARRAL